jgi:serine/threonine-protein kinase
VEGTTTRPAHRSAKAAVVGYEILGELGRGGMGVVYKARQVSLGRLVALKMILAGAHASSDNLQRFKAEAEAVAQLQHPNIVQVYEVGSRNGLPFFSLEYVAGGSLAQKLAGVAMPAREAAAVSETLARAMHHAHEKHIVHRDLKPANILLTPDGTPKITDFGLAKRLETDAGQTGTGAILGTPTYMAPEQAQGRTRDIGPLCDVYALGAILYDLLTGRPPFKGETVLDTLQLVQSVEPVPVRHLQPKVPRDLETICLKCLEKDPRKRYASALDLAADLRAFLDGKPIQARPIRTWERALKWARRRPALAALVVVSAAAVLALSVGAVVVAARETHLHGVAVEERNEAVRQKAEAEKQRGLAEERRKEAVQQMAVAEKQRRRADGHLQKAFQAGDELLTRAQGRLARVPGMEEVRRELLDRARAFYEGFLAVEGDTPEVRWQTGLARYRVALIEEKLGLYREAQRSYQAALPLLKRVAEESRGQPDHLYALASAYTDQAAVLLARDLSEEAGRAYAEAVAVGRRLVEAAPDPRNRQQLARSLNSQAGYLGGDPARRGAAEKGYQEALAILDRLCGEYPREPVYRSDKARTLADLGVLLQAVAPRKAEEVWTRALDVQKKLADDFPNAPDYRLEQCRTLLNLAVVWKVVNEPKRAAQACTEAKGRLERLVEDYGRVTDYRHELARAYTILGVLLEANKELDRAEAERKKARAHWVRLTKQASDRPVFRQELARSLVDLARYYLLKQEAGEAEDVLAQAMKLQEALVKEYPGNAEYRIDLARSHTDLGQLFGRRGKTEQEEKYYLQEEKHYLRAIALLDEARGKSTAPPADWLTLRVAVQHNLAGSLLDRKLWPRAAEAFREAIRYQGKVAAASPGDAVERQRLAFYHARLMETLGMMHDHAGVSAAARAYEPVLRQGGPSAAKDGLHAADRVAHCIILAEAEKGLAEAKRKALVTAYGDQAMALLREAVRHGYRDAASLRMSANFQALAERADFRALLAELEARKDGGKR